MRNKNQLKMNEPQKVIRFSDDTILKVAQELDEFVENVSSKYVISYASIVGIFEIKKQQLISLALGNVDEVPETNG